MRVTLKSNLLEMCIFTVQALIAGGGAIGSRLAAYLSERGEDVAVIEQDKEKCERISRNSDARVYNGNTLDPELLMEAGIQNADAFIVALGNDLLTRKVVDFAKSQFGVPKVIAIAKESELRDQIKSSGADKVICSQDEVLDTVEGVLQSAETRTIFHDNESHCLITRVAVRATSKALGQELSKIEEKSAKVCGLVRRNTFRLPGEDTAIEMGDELYVIGDVEGVEKVIDRVRQEA